MRKHQLNAGKATTKSGTKTRNSKNSKHIRDRMTDFDYLYFKQLAKTNQNRIQKQASKLVVVPTLREIAPVQPMLRGEPFGEKLFCPTGCEAVSMRSERIHGGVQVYIKYPNVGIAVKAKRLISILKSEKGKIKLLYKLPKKQKQAWKNTKIDVSHHSSPSTLVLKFISTGGEADAQLPPAFAARIFNSYPDFTSHLTTEDIMEYWKFYMMDKFNKSKK